jgi:hypothetical protein
MKKVLLALTIALSLSGCAESSGILPAGPDTYTLTEPIWPTAGGEIEAQRVVLEKASEFCISKGREMMPLDLRDAGALNHSYGPTGYSATFRCLLPTDAEFKR